MHIQKLVLVGVIASLCARPSAPALEFVFQASLDGPSESPPVPSPGIGTATAIYNDVAHTLRVMASFSGLIGTTTAAHIHAPTAVPLAGTVGVATTTPTFPGFPLGVTSGSFDQTYDLTLAGSFSASFLNTYGGGVPAVAEAALFQFLKEEKAYFNVHTTFRSGGEIRGFLSPVPDAGSSFGLLGLSCLALGLARRRGAQESS